MGEILGHQVSGAAAVNRETAVGGEAAMGGNATDRRIMEERLRAMLEEMGIDYDPAAPGRLAEYHLLLADWNTRMNLTGDTDFELSLSRLYGDSLAPLGIDGLFPQGARVVDVGSGAGFPGLPLAIVRPDLKVTLLDSLNKRIGFLNAVAEALSLTNVKAVHGRAEDAAHVAALREQFDLAVARAVAPLPVLCELLLPFVAPNGEMVCYKGPAAQEEWDAGQRAAAMLGGGSLKSLPVTVPDQPEWQHCVITCHKKEKTLRQYPRKAGMPSRSPLGVLDK